LCIVFIILSALMCFIGVTLIIMYINSAVIERLGEGDQSLLFWYLPLMLIGIICVKAGAKLYKMTRKRCRDQQPVNLD
jgi:uncharacterized membrane protein